MTTIIIAYVAFGFGALVGCVAQGLHEKSVRRKVLHERLAREMSNGYRR